MRTMTLEPQGPQRSHWCLTCAVLYSCLPSFLVSQLPADLRKPSEEALRRSNSEYPKRGVFHHAGILPVNAISPVCAPRHHEKTAGLCAPHSPLSPSTVFWVPQGLLHHCNDFYSRRLDF